MKIKFGTDGWRAIIAKEFTTDNVARVSVAVAEYLYDNFENPSVVIGHDCRFAGELFAETAAKVFLYKGVKVHMAKDFVSTPMVSYGTVQLGASMGIVITASHNPPSYNGYKLKAHFGGPLNDEGVRAVEALIPETHGIDLDSIDLEGAATAGALNYTPLEDMYVERLKEAFDLDLIRDSNLTLAYDAMYGSGQNVLKRLFPDMHFLHCEEDPTFQGISPEPILRNLGEYAAYIKNNGTIDCGLATDGDADRIGLFNGEGEFVDAHHILLLLIHYLKHYKNLSGKVATGFSSTVKMKTLCDHYGLELDVVPIGFKHVAGIMVNEDVLVGGEESGGIAVKGHIPERDGIWMGLVIWEFMARTKKSLQELIEEVYAITGRFRFERIDLKLKEEEKQRIVANCKANAYTQFGEYEVQRVDTLDGWKYILSDHQWVMIRPSGTEPVLRTYAESHDKESVLHILEACHNTILKS